jgi:polygalacturonase
VRADKYSLIVAIPQDLPLGEYGVWVHSGHGGSPGWGSGLHLTVKPPARWPETVFTMKDFGAKGDDITDDSPAFRKALEAAERNKGGIIYFPYGAYRLTGSFQLQSV